LVSEAERQRRINEAKGRAQEIELVAEATAAGIKRVAEAIQKPGGELAVKTKLVEQYIKQFGNIINNTNVSILPTETANLKTFFEGVSMVSDHTKDGAKTNGGKK
jgi:regulator of protease activity HflC (stomatin/prohibitin superfamily)